MFFDKVVIALVSPLGTALLLWLVALGLWCLARARLRAVAWALAALGWLWLLVWSLPVASHALRAQVEGAYPPLALAQVPQAQAIVLLGGGIRPAERAGQMPDMGSAADRVWLAARLYKAGKAPQVLVSGGGDRAVYATSEAQAMRELLLDMGVPDAALVLEEDSRNTRENAVFSARVVRERGMGRVLLVTSALHMQRAQALFEAQGLELVPVPADHEARHRFAAVDWLPDADALDGSARAMKELVGRWVGR
jgi:uncharacterized SAM-binding protein YcdF (DUF218 family)